MSAVLDLLLYLMAMNSTLAVNGDREGYARRDCDIVILEV